MPARVALSPLWLLPSPLVQALVGKWPAGEKGVGRPYGFLSVGENDDSRFEQLSLPNGAAQETDFRPLHPKSGGISQPFGTQSALKHPPFLGGGTGSGLFPKHRLCRGAWPAASCLPVHAFTAMRHPMFGIE